MDQLAIDPGQARSLIITEPGDRALSYVRVSKDETIKSTSLSKQRDYNQRAADALGIPLIDHETDERTGRTFKRDGLERLLERFERGEANTLIIFDVDRLSRKFGGYACLRELLHSLGVKIYLSGANAYLSPLAAERVNADLKGLLSEIEWETIRDRAGDGVMRKIVEQQLVPGKGQAPYGYYWEGVNRSRRLVIDPSEAAIIRHIFELYVNGIAGEGPLSMLKIVEWLNAHRDLYPAPNAEHRQSAYKSKRRPADEWVLATVAGVLNRTAYYGEWQKLSAAYLA